MTSTVSTLVVAPISSPTALVFGDEARTAAIRRALAMLMRHHAANTARLPAEALRQRNIEYAQVLSEFEPNVIELCAAEWIGNPRKGYPFAGELRDICRMILAAVTEEAHAEHRREKFEDWEERRWRAKQLAFERDMMPATRAFVERGKEARMEAKNAAALARIEERRQRMEAKREAK